MQNNVPKKILALLLAVLFAGSAMAQTTSKEINKIKRNPLYIYAESTMESESEARDVAYEMLMQQVEEYVASKRKLNKADNVLIKDIKSKGESMTMMRGTMYRVFVYVKKTDIEGVENTTVINAPSGTTIAVSNDPQTIVNVGNIPPRTTISESDIAVELPEGETGDVASPLSGWKQDAINSLLECEDINAVRARLNRLKAQYKVKNYGTADRCPSREKAFWVVFDDNGSIISILGEGAGERYDFKRHTTSSLDSYKGMSAIWFNLAK